MNSQLETVVFEMEKAVRGKRGVIEHILAALLAEGHILLDATASVVLPTPGMSSMKDYKQKNK